MIILRKQKYKELPWTKENIEKYKSQENMLKHARNTPGKTKQAAIAGTIAALPIGGAYVSGKIAIRKWNEKRKKNK